MDRVTISPAPTPYTAHPRANRLDDWDLVPVSKQMWYLMLRGAPEIVNHVVGAWPRAKSINIHPHDQPQWTHRIRLDFAPHEELKEFLDLLRKILVLWVRGSSDLDGAVALDFYKKPSATDPTQLENTPTAELIRTIKGYRSCDNAEVMRAGRALCDDLYEVVMQHPWLNRADRILPVPGHSRSGPPSASVRLGAALHHDLGIPLTQIYTRHEHRTSAKDMKLLSERTALLGEFRIRENLEDKSVLIVDDIYHTGCTMAGVARAARHAGATTILGLVAARVIRY
ncbi:ComF family protein [Actinokineospora xionganensis]|uniref:Phosphoribosyltransferase domain-containing protein n=1 Tax=Actinokineospora xionganensis TaxID=2684470 RepID=A0ABR7L4J7_9PSEU|nr:phosphoribosyltransferase family protein [Actinokineospora xionganensis]MBC6447611.1 hypothetical protein [Actinokineospora xionganensis]